MLKLNQPDAPWEVANEGICAALAGLVGLPVPPGTVAETQEGPGYVSLRFGDRSVTPPPLLNATKLIEKEPRLAAGVVVFDMWVWNPDRNPGNIAYAPPTFPLTIFDHGDALLSDTHRPSPQSRLLTPPPESFIAGRLGDPDDVLLWLERIERLDDGLVGEAVERVRAAGALKRADAKLATDYLKSRRTRLRDILNASPSIGALCAGSLV